HCTPRSVGRAPRRTRRRTPLLFVTAPAPPDLSTLPLHDALPICPVVNPLQHGAGGVVHHDVAPRQYAPRDLEEPVPAHAGTARATPGEWGDVLGRPHVVEDVRAGADHGPGAEQRADRRLRMVADQAAEQL